MKLLLFSDLHCDQKAARSLAERAAEVDVLVGAGDFAIMRRGLDKTFDILSSIERPAVLVPGNGESVDELAAAASDWPSAHVLHGTGVEIDGVAFHGLGGGVPITPFGEWSYDFSEEQASELLADCPETGVLVSHSPPKGTLDVASRGGHLGSTAVRETIDRCRPRLVVCGHIHDCAGRSETIAGTVVVNAGPTGIVYDL